MSRSGFPRYGYDPMKSIELYETVMGKEGQYCRVTVYTGDTYCGVFRGIGDATEEFPMTLRIGLNKKEASMVGVGHMTEIGVPNDVIDSIFFDKQEYDLK